MHLQKEQNSITRQFKSSSFSEELLKDFSLSHYYAVSIGTLKEHLIFDKLHFQYYSKMGYSSSERILDYCFQNFLQKS